MYTRSLPTHLCFLPCAKVTHTETSNPKVRSISEVCGFFSLWGLTTSLPLNSDCFWNPEERLRLGDFGLTRKLEDRMTPQMVAACHFFIGLLAIL